MLNPHFVAGEHGLFGGHKSEDIRTFFGQVHMYLKHLAFADRFARNSFKGVLLKILQGSNQHNKSSYSAGQLLNMEHYGVAIFGYFMQLLLTYFKDTS